MVKLVKELELKSNKQTHNIHKHKQFVYRLKGFKSQNIYKQIYGINNIKNAFKDFQIRYKDL